MGGSSKKKKSHKKKDHKKKKHKSKRDNRTPSGSSDSSTDSSESPSPPPRQQQSKTSADIFSKMTSDADWHLAQKSESLMFDQHKEIEDRNAETFIWRKKHEKTAGTEKIDVEKIALVNRLKQEEANRELEKLKKRKIEREREREEREREREFEQRQKESEYHQEWEKQEDSFQLKQVKLRSKIRIEEGRAKPIDLLAKYINSEEDDLAIEMHEPYVYLSGLTIRDLEDVLADINVYSDLEKGANVDYWKDIAIVTEEELRKLQRLDKNSREHAGDRHDGINQSVLQDVSTLFKGKTYEQLIQLEESIKTKIKSETGIDIGYWESLLSQLKAHMARARLKERHTKVLYQKLQTLKKQQGIDESESRQKQQQLMQQQPRSSKLVSSQAGKYKNENEIDIDDDDDGDESEPDEFDKAENENENEEAEEVDEYTMCVKEYTVGNYSPLYMSEDELEVGDFVVTQVEDEKRLEMKRGQVVGTGSLKASVEDAFEAKARETMGGIIPSISKSGSSNDDGGDDEDKQQEGRTSNTQEIALDHNYLWSDKYRPRKPRYYNRVHTGYDWNQYNKKHYDVDNPPPKTVQGYKFNTICKENRDFAVLRFHAGPPYEDVAFKVVSREWDISHRHGFRNQFQNGIYQLWFHFRKWKYRR